MSHPLRWIPEGETLVEVSTRTVQGRYFLRPTREVREIVLGVVGRAQRIHRMKLCSLVFMSSHYHMLLVPQDPQQLARFMGFVNGEIAREINRLTGWDSKFWARRFSAVVVSDEPAVQRARFRYLLSHGVKEGLVERPEDWSGAHSVDAWLEGCQLRGFWFDRARETRARRRGRTFDRLAFATEETVTLSPLPCWLGEGYTLEAIREEVAAMRQQIVEEEAQKRRRERGAVVGIEAVLAFPHDYRPDRPSRSPRPRFHALDRRVRESLEEGERRFVEAYREASTALRAGNRSVRFPDRCFPPALPFTGSRRQAGVGAPKEPKTKALSRS